MSLDFGSGLYWAAVGVLIALAAGVWNAWVLLIEIMPGACFRANASTSSFTVVSAFTGAQWFSENTRTESPECKIGAGFMLDHDAGLAAFVFSTPANWPMR
jgi:hypothetical protein